MATVKTAAVVSLLFGLAVGVVPVRAGNDEDPKAASMTPKHFAERITNVITSVSSGYYYKIERSELLLWAVKGLYDQRGNAFEGIPGDIAERLGNRNPLLKEIRELLVDVAKSMNGDLTLYSNIAVERMLRHLDSRTEVIENKYLHINWAYRAVGIGVRLEIDPPNDLIRVAYPFRDGPAYKAGLRSGDLITEIVVPIWEPERPKAPKVKVIDGKGLKLLQANECLLGEAGSKIVVKVRRAGMIEPLKIEVQRAKGAETESLLGVRRRADDVPDYWLDPARKVAYIRLVRFRDNTADELSHVLADLDKNGVRGLVLDLRGNESGLLQTGVEVATRFVGEAPICAVRNRHPEYERDHEFVDEQFKGTPGKTFRGFPIACLVNGETTGMGEVLAASLQDYKRATIIGELTAGEAAVNVLSNLGDCGCFRMRLTYAVFARPNGKKLDRIHPPGKPSDEWGVTPDKGYELALSEKEREQLRDHFASQLVIPPAGQAKPATEFRDRQLEIAVGYLRHRQRQLQGVASGPE